MVINKADVMEVSYVLFPSEEFYPAAVIREDWELTQMAEITSPGKFPEIIGLDAATLDEAKEQVMAYVALTR